MHKNIIEIFIKMFQKFNSLFSFRCALKRKIKSNKMSVYSRVGVKPRVEYVNRAGDPVDPKTGRPLAITTRKNKELVQYPHISYSKLPSVLPSSKGIKKAVNKKGKKPFPIKRTGAICGNLDPIPTDPRIDPPPHHCFNCWQKGHNRSQCPRPVADRYCLNCGRRGEDLTTCPRCARPYQIYVQQNGIHSDLHDDLIIDDLTVANNEPDTDEILQHLIYRDEERRQKEIEREVQERHIGTTAYEESSEPYREDSPQQYGGSPRQGSPNYPREPSPYRYDNSYNSGRDESPRRFVPEWGRKDDERDRDRSPYYKDRREDEYKRYRRDSPYRERSPLRSNGRKSPVDDYSKHTNLDDNPVQEMLTLIKSISHLPSSTQDLIIRQVMEERQYKLRLKQEQNEQKAAWP